MAGGHEAVGFGLGGAEDAGDVEDRATCSRNDLSLTATPAEKNCSTIWHMAGIAQHARMGQMLQRRNKFAVVLRRVGTWSDNKWTKLSLTVQFRFQKNRGAGLGGGGGWLY